MPKNKNYEYEETTVTLTEPDGSERLYYVDEIYEINGAMYASLIPGDVANVTEYFVYRLKNLGNDDFELEDIDDEDEYNAAADVYESLLNDRYHNMVLSGD